MYATVTGTAEEMATALYEDLMLIEKLSVRLVSMKDYSEEQFEKEDIVIALCSTWSEGRPPESAAAFFAWLLDYAYDFRVSKNAFAGISFATFGLGAMVYGEEKFCKPVVIISNTIVSVSLMYFLGEGLL